MLPTQACTSHTSPQGCFVHHWNVCVECCLRLHPIRTMCTRPIHKVPTYAHRPNSHFPHRSCTIMFPPYTLSLTQPLPRMFRIWSHCCIWTQLPTLSPTSWSDPASTLAPEALLLGGWHTHWRPTTTPQLPPAMFAHAHMPTSISSQIVLHLDLPIRPCHSSTQGSLAHHQPQRPSFQLVGAPIKCPPPPPISLWHSMHAHTRVF